MASTKRKVHLNWDSEKKVWLVKKSFGFIVPHYEFTEEELKVYLTSNEDVEVVARYF